MRPEEFLVKRVQDETLTENQNETRFSLYSERATQEVVAERYNVTPQAIGNQNSRIKDTVVKEMSRFGITGDNYSDYEAQTVLLKEQIDSMPTDTLGGYLSKFKEVNDMQGVLDERLKAFEASLDSGYKDLPKDDRDYLAITQGKADTERLIEENRELIRTMDKAVEEVLGSLGNERYQKVIRMKDIEGAHWDVVAAAVGIGKRGAEKMHDRAMVIAEEKFKEVRYA